jgi:arylsulfatase
MVVFEQAISQSSYTTYSVASLFTSKYPSRLRPLKLAANVEGVSVEAEMTLSQVLRDSGYVTCGVHSNPLLSKLFGFQKGFDFFEDSLLKTGRVSQLMKIRFSKLARLCKSQAYQSADAINRKALNWLHKQQKRPLFLWLHYMDCHGPYMPKRTTPVISKLMAERLWRKAVKTPREIDERQLGVLRSTYRERAGYVTACLRSLLSDLQKAGIGQNSLIIITADHGEEFAEHGGFTHQHKLYDELLRVPLIVKPPGRTGGAHGIERQVGLIDLLPTILGYAGIDFSKSDFEGRSLMPLIEDKKCDHLLEYTFSEADLVPGYHGCTRGAGWKFVTNEMQQKEELYDLQADPHEQTDLVCRYPEVSGNLRQIMADHLSGTKKKSTDRIADGPKMDQAVRDRLRVLGYVD